jgi:hypothetical protein
MVKSDAISAPLAGEYLAAEGRRARIMTEIIDVDTAAQ